MLRRVIGVPDRATPHRQESLSQAGNRDTAETVEVAVLQRFERDRCSIGIRNAYSETFTRGLLDCRGKWKETTLLCGVATIPLFEQVLKFDLGRSSLKADWQ